MARVHGVRSDRRVAWAMVGALWGALGLGGCTEARLPGHYWDLSLVTDADACNTPPVTRTEHHSYRLEFGVSDVAVAVDNDVFAAGQVSGCSVSYTSVPWTSVRATGDVMWTVQGEATVQRGDGSCGSSTDWVGTEVFTVVRSDDPAIRPGCTYTYTVSGSYAGEVE